MARILGILTNDPSLLPCQAARLEAAVPFLEEEALGLGSYDDADVLLTKRPANVGTRRLSALTEPVQSPALLAVGRHEAAYQEEALPPLRYRRWLFAMDGEGEALARVREPLEASLPAFLARSLRTVAARERVFFHFLKTLFEEKQLEDPRLEAAEAGRSLARALRRIDAIRAEAGEGRPFPVALLATNGRVLVGVRRGRALAYHLGEGSGSCERCGFEERSDDPRVPAHRRARCVALATLPAAQGFVEIPDESVVAVERSLQINVASL